MLVLSFGFKVGSFLEVEKKSTFIKMNRFTHNLYIMLLLLYTLMVTAQPGYYGAFEFKVWHTKKQVDLAGADWKVITYKTANFYPAHSYQFPGYYKINVEGGDGSTNLVVDIVFKKDTMRVYAPSIDFRAVTLDSIPFKKGVFKIPTHIYDLQEWTKLAPDYEFIPDIKGNWDLFSDQKEVYKCYIEKVEDLELVSSPLLAPNGGNTMMMSQSSLSYFFKKNYIIRNHDGYDENNQWDHKHYIYEIKNIDDTTFWGGKILKYEIVSIYSKEGALYGLLQKRYFALNQDTYGVYKLHFIDEEKIDEKEARALHEKQIEEDYQAAMKIQGYSGALKGKIQLEYSKVKKIRG